MMPARERGMMKIISVLLTILGSNPDRTGIIPTTISIIAVVSTGISTFMMILEIFLNWNGIATLKRLDYLPSSIMCVVKSAVLATNRNRLRRLFARLDQFWPTDKFTPEVHKECEDAFVFMKKFMLVFYTYGCSTVLYTVIAVLTRDVRALPNKGFDVCDYEANSFCFYAMTTWHAALMWLQAAPSLFGFDFIYLACATYVYVASKLINAALVNMHLSVRTNPELAKANLKDIVDEHNNLLDFVKETNEYVFVAFSAQFLCSAGSMVFCMYLLTVNGIPPDKDNLRFAQIYMLFAGELFMLNMAGSISKDQLSGIAESAYETEWFEVGEGKLRRDLSLIILRSQTTFGLRVAKVFDMNLNLFVTIVKASFSIYTLLDQLTG